MLGIFEQVGLSQFPDSAQMTLLYSNLQISVADNYHSGFSQAKVAKKQVGWRSAH